MSTEQQDDHQTAGAVPVDCTGLVDDAVCPECNGTGKIGDSGPGGVLIKGKWTGNMEWDKCDCTRDAGKASTTEVSHRRRSELNED